MHLFGSSCFVRPPVLGMVFGSVFNFASLLGSVAQTEVRVYLVLRVQLQDGVW